MILPLEVPPLYLGDGQNILGYVVRSRRCGSLPAVAVPGEGQQFHDSIFVVVEFVGRLLAHHNGRDALRLDLFGKS